MYVCMIVYMYYVCMYISMYYACTYVCMYIYVRMYVTEMFYLTTHSTHFIYGYMASDMVKDHSDR